MSAYVHLRRFDHNVNDGFILRKCLQKDKLAPQCKKCKFNRQIKSQGRQSHNPTGLSTEFED